MLKTMTVRTAIAAIVAGLSMSAYAIADSPKAVDIPAGDLRQALLKVSEQFGTDLIYSPEQVQGLKTGGAHGQLTTEQAVTKLLEGTRLELRTDPSGAMLIAPPAAAETSFLLPEAGSEREQWMSAREEKSFWSRLRLAQLDTGSPSRGEGSSENSRRGRADASSDDSPQSQKRIELEEIIVTGTHIRGVAPAGSPVLTFTRSDIDKTGASTVGEFLRKVPQNFSQADQETVLNNGGSLGGNGNSSRGTAVNLRGLGGGATLTLLDGQRLSPSGTDGSFVDVSLIPLAAIERIEMLTDGASAIYGADAVGGVVNFILRRDFQGAETAVKYGDSTRGGGATLTANQLLGTSWKDGNVMVVHEYFDQDGVDVKERDFIPAVGLGTVAPFMIQPEQRRNSTVASVRQSVTSHLDVFGHGFFSERRFVQDTSNIRITHTTGEVQSAGGSLGADLDLSGEWEFKALADRSVTKEERQFVDTPGGTVKRSQRSASSGIDARLSGTLFHVLGASARASLGVSARRETFDRAITDSGELDRDVESAYAELYIPLVTPSTGRWTHRLEVSLAGRLDDYSDFGSSGVKPKVGVTWAPTRDVALRASWAESFRAPLLSQMDTTPTSAFSYVVLNLPDPTSPTLFTPTIFPVVPGNPSLDAERSTSFTIGVDFTPESVPNLRGSLTYYDVEYTDKVSTPPLIGATSLLYRQEAVLAPFINRSPDPAVVASYYEQGVLNPFGIAASDVRAVYDSRYHNIASTRTSGFDFNVSYSFDTAFGTFSPQLSANYITDMNARSAPTTPEAALYDNVFTPASLKGRAGVSWALGPLSAALSANYVDSYENETFTPSTQVDDWVTLDWHLQYDAGDRAANPFWRGVSLTFDVQNLADAAPPHVSLPPSIQAFDLGYDATNASALGRFVSLRLAKRW